MNKTFLESYKDWWIRRQYENYVWYNPEYTYYDYDEAFVEAHKDMTFIEFLELLLGWND